jgi:AAA domain/DnaB-like helicase N terminal domain
MAILAGVLLDNQTWPQASRLASDDFALGAHRVIFLRMCNLAKAGHPIDMLTLVQELDRHKELNKAGGVAYVSSLIDGVPDRPSIEHYIEMLRHAAGLRHAMHGIEDISQLVSNGAALSDLCAHLLDLSRLVSQYDSSSSIRQFSAIPELLNREVRVMDYLVQDLIPTQSLTLWTGVDGAAKTFLAQCLAIAASAGSKFLGSQCPKMEVLYLDYENPDFAVRGRLELMGAKPNPNLKIWGTWLSKQPPQVGSQILLDIANEVHPLMIFDPFRYSHGAEENDSTEMMAVMKSLRSYAVAGATVIILHHPSKVEGSTGRGSTAIRGAVDLAYVQELSDESGLITVKCVKNRFGKRETVTIKPDFDEGTFDVVDSPQDSRTMADLDELSKIIREIPWLPQNQVLDRWNGNKQRGIQLLRKYTGSRWERVQKGRTICYGPTVPESRNYAGTDGTDKGIMEINISSKPDAALEPIATTKLKESLDL